MTVEFALNYIPRRMRELGYGENYLIRWRHFQIDPIETRTIEGYNEYYMLIQPSNSIKVASKFGIFDLSDLTITEMLYEHRGKILVKNTLGSPQMVLFIQVIPQHAHQVIDNH